jgi:hypothetical protein
MKNVSILLIVAFILFFAYRSCTKGYDRYAFFVHAEDSTLFASRLSSSDPRIMDHGRRLKEEILLMDREVDCGDGPGEGRLRWYVCSGIDCDEGWEQSFIKRKKTSGEVKTPMDDHDLQKIEEYNRYQPENALRDAELDIGQGTLRLFCLDIEEVPEPIAIAGDPEALPSHEWVSIGVGCTDTIHSEDCPSEYRKAMENALSYGIGYNKAITRHFNLKLKQHRDRLPNSTLEFLGAESDWRAVQMELRDIQPLFGGRDVWVDGSGNVCVRSVQTTAGGLEEKIYRLPQEESAAERTLEAFIAQDFLSLCIPEQTGPPDHGRPEIRLTNFRGQLHEMTGWDPPLSGSDPVVEQRFRAVYRALLRLESVAKETAEPLHRGVYGDPKRWTKILREAKGS